MWGMHTLISYSLVSKQFTTSILLKKIRYLNRSSMSVMASPVGITIDYPRMCHFQVYLSEICLAQERVLNLNLNSNSLCSFEID